MESYNPEKIRANLSERPVESEAKKFDREAEKQQRKEIRKQLEHEFSVALKVDGFKKEGSSKWLRKVGDTWHVVYLQRSYLSHEYFIEAGICNTGDIPRGKKPDIVFCGKDRARIESVIADVESSRVRSVEDETTDAKVDEKVKGISEALKFEPVMDVDELYKQYPDGYAPSVSRDEAESKIELIRNTVQEYVPAWFKLKEAD